MEKKIITIIIICSILLCFSINVFSDNEIAGNNILENETNSEANNMTLWEQKTEVDNKLTESNSRLEYVKNEISASLQKVQELDDSINDYQNKYNNIQAQITSLENEINTTENDLSRIEEEYLRKENLLKRRVVAMYEDGDATYLDVLLSSKSLFDFLSNYYMLEQIVELDSGLLDELTEQKHNVEVKKAEQDKKKTDLRVARAKEGQMQILMENQKTYLNKADVQDIYLIGGADVVSDKVGKQLKTYDKNSKVERVAGSNRYKTSVEVAKTFFPDKCDTAVLAYGMKFPDGLAGGPLAISLKAPLLLVEDTAYADAREYGKTAGLKKLAALGGQDVISDKTVKLVVQ